MNCIQELNSSEVETVNGGVWLLLAAVAGAVYGAVEVGRALHGATCDEHEERNG